MKNAFHSCIQKKPVVLLALSVTLLFAACEQNWVMPGNLAGTWSSREKATVRFTGGQPHFQFVSDSVNIVVNIHADRSVDGMVGSARFVGCSVDQNRGELGRKLNLATDFIITGNLKGGIFPKDTLSERRISMPFNLNNGMMDGSLFHKSGMGGIFPMAGLHLRKQ